jgi:hypothetical protein
MCLEPIGLTVSIAFARMVFQVSRLQSSARLKASKTSSE